MQQLTPAQEAWLAGLESGQYAQGKNYLLCKNRHCCLGVACVMYAPQLQLAEEPVGDDIVAFDGCAMGLPHDVTDHLRLHSQNGVIKLDRLDDARWNEAQDKIAKFIRAGSSFGCLAELNDNDWTFAEIAKFCRDYPEAVFKP